MKFLNDFKNLFAILGVVSIIFWTCSAESSSDDSSSNLPQITGGTYQVSSVGDNSSMIVVLNTETGVMKTYFGGSLVNAGIQWQEAVTNYAPITFTH